MKRVLMAVLLMWVVLPDSGVAQHPLFSVGIGPGVAHFPGDAYGTLPTFGVRAEWRFDGDFAAFGEARVAGAGDYTPAGCVVDLCDGLVGGGRTVRVWHVGLETRLAYYRPGSRNRFTAYAGFGQEAYYEPRREHASERITDARYSLLVGLANRFALGDRLGVRLSAGLAAWYEDGNTQGLPSLHEVPMASVMMTYDFGRGR